MTPEEAIEELNHELLILKCLIEEVNSFICDCDVDDEYDDEKEQFEISLTRYKKEKEVIDMAISAIKELQQYREIGTVEECKELASMFTQEKKNALSKIVDEWNEYIEIGTVEECRKAVEKQKAKKPDIYTDTRNMVDLHGNVYAEQANVYLCPTCENFIGYVGNNIFHYCPVCGQAIDENLEGMEDERD